MTPDRRSPDVALVPIPVEVLRMLAVGDLVAASRAMGMPMPPTVLDSQWVWNTFAERSEAEPEHAAWFTQYLVVEDGRMVGDVRLHRPPSAEGEVTIGYQVVPVERRRGVAVAAVRALLDLVRTHPEVRLVVAQVNPANTASLGVCRRLGFVDVGTEVHRLTGETMRRLELPLDRA